MPHPVLSALKADRPAPQPPRTARPEAWRSPPATGPEIAVLLTDCADVVAAVRGYRTVLPRARVLLYGDALASDLCSAAEAAGALVRHVPPGRRGALVTRMLADVDADIYILAHGAGPEDVCLAPLIVAEIEERERDLVDVSRFVDAPGRDVGDRLLSRCVDFLFGRGGEALSSEFKACSRRFALSYRAAGSGRDPARAPALDLSLHALRMRLPLGHVTALAAGPVGPRSGRGLADWVALGRLIAILLVEERPRRVLGLAGLALVAAGIGAMLPALSIHDGWATLPHGAATLLGVLLMGCGALVGTAGVALDSLTSARQDIARVAVSAIPRRAERPA